MSSLEKKEHHYRDWVLREFATRKGRNPGYSLRAFAKWIGISKTTLSDVLQGKRHFSKAAALQVAQKLELSPQQREILLHEIRRPSARALFEHLTDSVDRVEFLQLQEDQFKVISDWYYIGILTLAQLKEHKAEPAWISKKLSISQAEASTALSALQRLGLIEIKKNRLVRTSLPIQSTHQISSAVVRKYHKQNLHLAEASLERDSIERRIFGAISMPVNPADLRKADQLIQDFKLRMASLLATDSATDVYTLSVQLFPLTQPQGEHDHVANKA